jgi:hypothetical protein
VGKHNGSSSFPSLSPTLSQMLSSSSIRNWQSSRKRHQVLQKALMTRLSL